MPPTPVPGVNCHDPEHPAPDRHRDHAHHRTPPAHLMLATPEVETATLAVPEDTEARTAALACISEARRHMGVEPGRSQPADIAHAQRPARSIDALCRQYEALNCGQVTGDHWSPAQLAFRRWAIHGTKCWICRSDDSHCDRSRRLGDHWNQLRRNPPTTTETPAPAAAAVRRYGGVG
nr:DUF6415 family natural product biosynthesis protein [Streptomyces sp. N502]